MVKVPFSKLEVKLNTKTNQSYYENSKGEKIYYDVKYYLPIQEKTDMISNIINQSMDENGYYNPMKIKIFTVLEVTYAYTSLSFTAKQKKDYLKLYDLLVGNGLFKNIVSCISEDDWTEIQETVLKVIDNIYKYRNSALGIMETISSDYNGLNFDANNIQAILEDGDSMGMIKDILNKLG